MVSVDAFAHGHHLRQGAGAKNNLSQEQLQEVEAKLANIIRKYGKRLSDEEKVHLRKIVSHNEVMLASVRSFPLKNGDTPASTLRITFAPSSDTKKGKD